MNKADQPPGDLVDELQVDGVEGKNAEEHKTGLAVRSGKRSTTASSSWANSVHR